MPPQAPHTQPRFVYHYTSEGNARDIADDCWILKSAWGTDGPGVYVTDLPPTLNRLGISEALWEKWHPRKMEAYVRLPFLAGEMVPSERYPRVWVVKDADLPLTGLEDLEVGVWDGRDRSDPADVGAWRAVPLARCR